MCAKSIAFLSQPLVKIKGPDAAKRRQGQKKTRPPTPPGPPNRPRGSLTSHGTPQRIKVSKKNSTCAPPPPTISTPPPHPNPPIGFQISLALSHRETQDKVGSFRSAVRGSSFHVHHSTVFLRIVHHSFSRISKIASPYLANCIFGEFRNRGPSITRSSGDKYGVLSRTLSSLSVRGFSFYFHHSIIFLQKVHHSFSRMSKIPSPYLPNCNFGEFRNRGLLMER